MTELACDHSALTEIFELRPADREAVVAGLRLMGRFRLTTVNVLEAYGHGRARIRKEKLAFYRNLTGDLNPIDAPNDLLRKSGIAYHEGRNEIEVGSAEARALLYETKLPEDLYHESFAWNKERKAEFKKMHQELRQVYQKHFESVPADRAKTVGDLTRYFCERVDTYLEFLIIPFYERATNLTITRERALDFTNRSMPWRLFWVSRIHALFTRSIQEQGSSDRKNAGQVDLESAIYLSLTHIFVTADKAQYDAFIDINEFNPTNARIYWWPDIRKGFLGI